MADELLHTLLPVERDAIAPDGSHVRVLCHGERGSMAHFELAPGEIARAVVHRTVDELWYVLDGLGRMWRQPADRDPVEVDLRPGTSLAIPVGTTFQFRNTGRTPLVAVAVTMPPWPGGTEATVTDGPWVPTV